MNKQNTKKKDGRAKNGAANKLPIPQKSELEHLYLTKKLPLTEIGKHYGCSNVTAKKWLVHHSIPIRQHKDTIKIAMSKLKQKPGNAHINKKSLEILDSKEKLQTEFDRTGYNRTQMSRHLGVSNSAIDKRLALHDLGDRYRFSHSSTDEHDLADFIQKNRPDVSIIRNTRKICPPKEIDIYLPELNLAIEYCGLFFHTCNGGGKTEDYHQNKMIECKQKNIKLLTIFSNEWNDNRKIVESRLLSALNVTPRKIHARKCEIKQIDSKTASEFLNGCHIQGGSAKASVSIALIHNNEIVAVMTFGKPRFNKKFQWELVRFANTLNTTVVGGASKLLSFFEKTYAPESCVSYCDLRWGDGLLYKALGFDLKTEYTRPNYFYVQQKKLESRMKYQKHRLNNILEKYDESLTEKQNMLNNGYDWIHDCGNSVWSKTR